MHIKTLSPEGRGMIKFAPACGGCGKHTDSPSRLDGQCKEKECRHNRRVMTQVGLVIPPLERHWQLCFSFSRRLLRLLRGGCLEPPPGPMAKPRPGHLSCTTPRATRTPAHLDIRTVHMFKKRWIGTSASCSKIANAATHPGHQNSSAPGH